MSNELAVLAIGALASAGVVSAFIWSRFRAFDRKYGPRAD